MKRSDVVILAVIGSAYAATLFGHEDIYRDQYRSREDCARDWGREARDCQPEGGAGGSYGYWNGPRYEDGARPRTSDPGLRAGQVLVQRGGFGTTGARYTRGGS